MENNLVNIIIPFYNSSKYLESCILSVLKQTYKNIEIFLVDDGSTDNSLNIANKFAKLENVHIYSKHNEGAASARNFGIDVCKDSGYIAFVDSDDTIEPSYIETMVKAADNSDICYLTKNKIENKKEDIVLGFCEKDIAWGPILKLIKTSLLKDNKFNKTLIIAEDIELNSRLILNAKSVSSLKIDSPLYNYIQNPASLTHGKINSKKLFDSCYGYYLFYKNTKNGGLLNKKSEHLLLSIISEHYLESSPYFLRNYKTDDSNELKLFVKTNKLIKKYKPKTKKESLKKFLFLYFKPIYKILILPSKIKRNLH